MSKSIIGKIVIAIQIADDKKALRFVTPDGDVIARTDGDCCSASWVESVDLPFKGLPATVLDVVNLDLSSANEEREYGELVQHYGCEIKTDKGAITIEYRNESNGYYGGELCWPDDPYFYGGVFGQNVSSEQWVDLPTDALR